MVKSLLLLHGALGSKSGFNSLRKALEPHFDVYAFDFEGHGESQPNSRTFRIEFFAENLLDFMDTHRLDAPGIFGYSMGGYVALWLARSNPERVSSIFTLGTKFLWTQEVAEKETKHLHPETLQEKNEKFVDSLKSQHGAKWSVMLEKTAEMMRHLGDVAAVPPAPFDGLASKIRLGIGDRDKMVTLGETLSVYKSLPNAELLVMPGTPHQLERVPSIQLQWHIRQFFGG